MKPIPKSKRRGGGAVQDDKKSTYTQDGLTGSCSVSIMILFLPLKTLHLFVTWDKFEVLCFFQVTSGLEVRMKKFLDCRLLVEGEL